MSHFLDLFSASQGLFVLAEPASLLYIKLLQWFVSCIVCTTKLLPEMLIVSLTSCLRDVTIDAECASGPCVLVGNIIRHCKSDVMKAQEGIYGLQTQTGGWYGVGEIEIEKRKR